MRQCRLFHFVFRMYVIDNGRCSYLIVFERWEIPLNAWTKCVFEPVCMCIMTSTCTASPTRFTMWFKSLTKYTQMDLYVVWKRNAVPIAAHQTDNSAKSSSDNISYLKEEGKKMWESFLTFQFWVATTQFKYMHFEILRQMFCVNVLEGTGEIH